MNLNTYLDKCDNDEAFLEHLQDKYQEVAELNGTRVFYDAEENTYFFEPDTYDLDEDGFDYSTTELDEDDLKDLVFQLACLGEDE
jgi:hypothetical protein